MKLHLPKGLRTALLACLAAFAGIGTTVSTATITGGVFAVAIAGQAQAADIPDAETDGDIWLPTGEYTLTEEMNNAAYLINSAEKVEYKVESGSVFIQTGEFPGWGQSTGFTKLGEGTLVVTGLPVINAGTDSETTAESVETAAVSAGTLELAYDGTIPKIVVSGGTGVISSTLSAKDVTVSGGTLKVDGSLTLSGTLTLTSAIQMGESASFTMEAGSILDISDLQADDDGDGKTYTILSGTGNNRNLSSLTDVRIIGPDGVSGVTWTFSTDGKVSYTLLTQMGFAGGDLTWNKTDAVFTQDGAQVAYADGSYAVFSGVTNATLGENIYASALKVEQGATLTITRGEYSLTADAVELEGTLCITEADVFKAGKIDVASVTGSGTIQLDADAVSYTNDNALPTDFTGKVLVSKGQLIINTDGEVYESVTVTSGGDARFEKHYAGAIFMEGTGNGWGSGAIQLGNGVNLSGEVSLTNDASVVLWDSSSASIAGKINLDHKLSVTVNNVGGDTPDGGLTLTGDILGGGGIEIVKGKLQIGQSNSATSALETGDVTINGGATLYIHHGGGSFLGKDGAAANLTMKDNSLLENYDISDSSQGHQWGTLTVEGTANVAFGTGQGIQKFTNLTAGDGEHHVDVHSKNDANRQQIHFATITDFNGSIGYYVLNGETYELGSNASKIHIGTVSQSEGKALTISGGATTSAFVKTGAGSLAVDNLVVAKGGKLTVNYEGTLTIRDLTLGNNATLAYTSVTDSVLSLGADLFADKTFTLDVSALEQEALAASGLNTGIASTVDESIFTLALGEGSLVGANVRFEKDEANGIWKLVCDKPVDASIWEWAPTVADTVWTDSEAEGWTAGGASTTPAGQKLVFGEAGLGEGDAATVKIAGQVTAETISVETAAGKSYTFTSDADETTGEDGIAAGALTKTGAGNLVLETANASTGDLTVEAGTVQIGSTAAAGDWAGDIAVKDSSTLDVTSVSDNALGTITADAGATVKVAGGTTIASLGGGSLEAATAADSGVTITTTTGAFSSVKNTGDGTLAFGSGLSTDALTNTGTVTTAGETTIGTLDNAGTITTGSNAISITTVTNGGKVDAGSGAVTLGSKASFTSLTAGSTTTAGNTITVEEGSTLGAVTSSTDTATSLVAKAGIVSLTTSTLQDVAVSSKTTVSVVGNLTVQGDITTAEDGTGAESTWGKGVAATGDILVKGDVDFGGRLASDFGAVTVEGDATTGGELKAAGNVTLGAGGTIGGSLSAGSAVIGGATTVKGNMTLDVSGKASLGATLDVDGTVSGMTRIEVKDGVLAAAPNGAPILTAGTLEGDALTIAFTSMQSVLDLGIEPGTEKNPGIYTLVTTDVAMDTLALTLVAPKEAGISVLANGDGSFIENAILYRLVQSDDMLAINLTATYVGCDWVSTDGTWTQDEAGKADWSAKNVPDAETNVVFNGNETGVTTVTVKGAAVAKSITVDTAALAATTGKSAYTFSGAEGATLSTELISVVSGGATLEGITATAGAVVVGQDGAAAALTVGAGSVVAVTGDMQVNEVAGDALGFSNAGTVVVSGALTVANTTKELDNSYSLSFGDGSSLGTVANSGTLTATSGSSTVENLTVGGTLAAEGGASMLVKTVSSGSIDHVLLDGASTITVGGTYNGEAMRLGALTGTADSHFNAQCGVVLESATTQGGHVAVDSLDITQASGSTLASLQTSALTINVNDIKNLGGAALLTLEGAPAAPISTALTLAGLAEGTLDTSIFTYNNADKLGTYGWEDLQLADGSYFTREWTSYTLVDAGTGYDWTLDDTQKATLQQLFAVAGTYAMVDTTDGNVLLKVYKDDPRQWVSSNPDWAGNETNNGGEVLDVSKLPGTYTDFDTVDAVIVDGSAVVELTNRVDANNVLSNATDTSKGVVLRDVQGEGNLYLLGDSAWGGLDTKDLVTISNVKDGGTTLKGQLFGNSVAIQVEGAGENTSLTVDSIELWENAVLTVLETGKLTATGDANLDKSSVLVNDGGELTIDGMAIVKSGVLEARSGATLTTGVVKLADAGAALIAADGSTVNVGALVGEVGTVMGKVTVTGQGGDYSGGYVDATVELAEGAQQTLAAKAGLSLTGSKAEATLSYAADATAAIDSIDVSGTRVTLDNVADGVMNTLTIGEASAMQGGELAFSVKAADVAAAANYGTQAPVITDGAALDLTGTQLTVTQTDTAVQRTTFDVSQGTEDITLMTVSEDGTMDGVTVSFGKDDKFFSRYFENVEVKDGKVVADLVTDRYSRNLAESENGTVGLQMMDAADLALNPMGVNDTVGDNAQYADLAGILHSLEGFRATGDSSSADKLGAAVAGSGMASLGMALAGDMERQLKAIRNRTTTMGVDPSVVNEEMPYFNAWINAEGDHRSLDEDGTLAGYSLSSWGGTVGFDMDVNPNLTWGLALTAMHGDFSAEAVDSVEGDLDTYYVSGFARATSGAWVHTFVASLGISKSDLERTVSHANGSYSTDSDADGMSFGFLYEVGRTFALNEDATACWQPVFNVSYRHTMVDGVSESGSDAALQTGDQTLDTLTFGLGGRLQAVIGENIYNRTSIFEARALVKLDAGDRQSEMSSALMNLPSAGGTMKSAEMDAFGIEVGAGLTVPMGMDSGSIFIDASAEFRGAYTSVNGTVGYRINF